MIDLRALCAELARVLELSIESPGDFDVAAFELIYDARAALSQPESEGPTIGDVRQLWASTPHIDEAEGAIAFARTVLARWGRPTPQPISVNEQLPGPEDCDAEGLCWVWNTTAYTWGLFRLDLTVHSHWLPHWALPAPQS